MLTEHAQAIWHRGVEAVRAARLVRDHVQVREEKGRNLLQIADHPYDLSDVGSLMVVGAGKAGAPMAEGFEAAIGDRLAERLHLSGWVNVPEGTERELRWIHLEPARPAGVNEPTPQGVEGSRQIIQRVSSAEPDDLCIALISGGGSALLPLPVEGISLEDKRTVTRFLSGAGADIGSLNVVRKHLSAIKGGKLAAACRARRLVTLVISDVLGDPLDLIASGPTVDDSSTPADALEVLSRFDPDGSLPEAIYRVLREAADRSPQPAAHPMPQRQTAIIGNNAVAVDEAGAEAERRGFSHVMTSSNRSEGEAEEVGIHLAEMAMSMLRREGDDRHQPDCLIAGGEPTVRLAPSEERGRGGRNQQLVLAALQRLVREGDALEVADRERLVILSGGTDGEDGPTDAAGAILDAAVWQRAIDQRLDIDDYLRRNDAYTFFEKTGGLLKTGPTHTNVCDVRVVLAR